MSCASIRSCGKYLIALNDLDMVGFRLGLHDLDDIGEQLLRLNGLKIEFQGLSVVEEITDEPVEPIDLPFHALHELYKPLGLGTVLGTVFRLDVIDAEADEVQRVTDFVSDPPCELPHGGEVFRFPESLLETPLLPEFWTMSLKLRVKSPISSLRSTGRFWSRSPAATLRAAATTL